MAGKIVGYIIEGHDNDTYMLDADAQSIQRCPYCKYRIDFLLSNIHYGFTETFSPAYMDVAVPPQTDLSVTYDGQVVVSKRFKEFCLQQEYAGLNFIDFLLDKDHFHFFAFNEVKVNIVRGKTRFDKLCPVCNNYKSVTQGYEFLQREQPLPDGFYRTNLLFGSGDAKSPAIIIGSETKLKLEAAGMTGLEFEPAYGL